MFSQTKFRHIYKLDICSCLAKMRKKYFLTSQHKHMVWVLKRTDSIRRFFSEHITNFKSGGYENIFNYDISKVQTKCLASSPIRKVIMPV